MNVLVGNEVEEVLNYELSEYLKREKQSWTPAMCLKRSCGKPVRCVVREVLPKEVYAQWKRPIDSEWKQRCMEMEQQYGTQFRAKCSDFPSLVDDYDKIFVNIPLQIPFLQKEKRVKVLRHVIEFLQRVKPNHDFKPLECSYIDQYRIYLDSIANDDVMDVIQCAVTLGIDSLQRLLAYKLVTLLEGCTTSELETRFQIKREYLHPVALKVDTEDWASLLAQCSKGL